MKFKDLTRGEQLDFMRKHKYPTAEEAEAHWSEGDIWNIEQEFKPDMSLESHEAGGFTREDINLLRERLRADLLRELAGQDPHDVHGNIAYGIIESIIKDRFGVKVV